MSTTNFDDSDYGLLDGLRVDVEDNAATYAKTSKKEYFELIKYANTTSYSQLQELHACPRKLLLKKLGTSSNVPGFNYDFAYGHSVGAGVQNLLVTKDIDYALFNAMLAWSADFEGGKAKGKKTIWQAQIAVEKFQAVLDEQLADWKLVTLPAGKPAIELAVSLDCNNGYKHYMHIDAVLHNTRSGEIAVLELKTSSFKGAEEALYANSAQALSYAVALDAIFPGLTSYEVIYAVYSSTSEEWELMVFNKSTQQKAEWIKDLLLDHMVLQKYQELDFFPKRGENCFTFFRRCEYFGTCNLIPAIEMPVLDIGNDEAEPVDYALSLRDIVTAQKGRV